MEEPEENQSESLLITSCNEIMMLEGNLFYHIDIKIDDLTDNVSALRRFIDNVLKMDLESESFEILLIQNKFIILSTVLNYLFS